MPAEKEPQIESREKEPIDFARIFREKLASIKPNESGELENIRVRDWPSHVKIKREAVVLVFILKDQFDKYDLWLDDWQDIRNKVYPHRETENNLKNFCREKAEKSTVKSYDFLIENQEGGVWLLTGGNVTDDVEESINSYHIDSWLDVCSRYDIEKIIGIGDFIEEEEVYSGETREILNQDIVGQIREERHLLDFIEKHRDILDTNTKILRFRVLAETAREAAKKQETPYSLESILEDMEKES